MRRTILVLVPLMLVGCGAEQPGSGKAPAQQDASGGGGIVATGRLDRSRAGQAAPDFQFRDPSGEAVSLADFQGKPVLLNLWATWCAPCVAEMPTLDALGQRRGDVQVLAVSQDLGGRDKVDSFFAKHAFGALEPYTDPEMALMTALKVDTLPTTILFDEEGREVWRMTGVEDWNGSRAAKLIDEARAG